LIYTLYDLSFLVCPEWSTEENRVRCFQGVFNASLHADCLLAISRHTRDHFLSVFPHYPPDRVKVVYPASRFADTRPGAAPKPSLPLSPRRFWLHVGSLEPRKNQLNLLKAYARLKAERETDFPLVFAGGRGWLVDDLEEKAEALGIRENVLFLGYVEDRTLAWLYENCFAFVYPPFFEGFGLPVLEAMSLGAPVITSAVASLPEVAGDAALLFAPEDEQALFSAMRRLRREDGLRQTLQAKGRARSREFSWERAAAEVLSIYEEVNHRPRLFAD
jgi:glycosyltransferase involved in cell wall biosynthesis